MKKIILKQNNLVLEQISLKDAKELFLLVDKNRKYLRQWLPWLDRTKSVSDIKKFIKRVSQKPPKGERQFVIYFSGNMVGMIGLHNVDTENRQTSIGYWLSEDAQGQGIMTRACKMVVDYGFKKLKLNRIKIKCAVDNKKSCAIPKRLGFKKEGLLRQSERLYDRFVDVYQYSLLASDRQKK